MIFKTMYKKLLLILMISLSVFSTTSEALMPPKFSKDLIKITDWFQGKYQNQSQVRRDTTAQAAFAYVVPIWENLVTDAIWMYEEITDDKQVIISQRIYRFADVNAFQWEAVIYELTDMERYAGEWQKPEPFEGFDPEADLNGLAECTIIFNKKGDNKYAGATIRKECKYGKKNAFYVTSSIEIYEEKVIRADRGFEHDHTQLWGPAAEQKGFEFKKIDQKLVDAKAKAAADKEAEKAKARQKALQKKEAAKAKAEAKKAAKSNK